MYQDKRRSCPRDPYQAPILISDRLDGRYSSALMKNHSPNGMYLVYNQPLGFDTGVYVNLLETHNPDIYRGFYGRVKWCRELRRADDHDDHFGVGINFVIRSHNYFGGIGNMIDCCCDVCGEWLPLDKLIRTDDFMFQCRDCYEALKHYPEGNLKSSVTNYLMGNIL